MDIIYSLEMALEEFTKMKTLCNAFRIDRSVTIMAEP